MVFSRRIQCVFLTIFACTFFFATGTAYTNEMTGPVLDEWEALSGGESVSEIPNLIHVPLVRQTTGYACGVAALQSVLGYYGQDVRADKLEKALDTRPESGTDYRNILKYAANLGYNARIRRGLSLRQLERLIDARKPVIAVIQAWRDRRIPDWPNDWADGHYVVAVGYDDQNFYFMDPSTMGNYTYIPRNEFRDRWHDIDQRGRKLRHTGIVIDGKEPRFSPDNVKRLK